MRRWVEIRRLLVAEENSGLPSAEFQRHEGTLSLIEKNSYIPWKLGRILAFSQISGRVPASSGDKKSSGGGRGGEDSPFPLSPLLLLSLHFSPFGVE
ncbi:hypothetical protein MA16_Dca004098 [Dendrobium catenatum]|uniref:Uncharacterized protein n=1 Tax=Dendrobium catenatum TaxID=906689 RepID=A0A2I0X2F7_9ASPA|nr:hypothetical protein MA16_Dca004098 [Dendrobium catenatum]